MPRSRHTGHRALGYPTGRDIPPDERSSHRRLPPPDGVFPPTAREIERRRREQGGNRDKAAVWPDHEDAVTLFEDVQPEEFARDARGRFSKQRGGRDA